VGSTLFARPCGPPPRSRAIMDAITTADAVTFDFQKLSARDRYKADDSERWCQRPRSPVTRSIRRQINAAPFSFFNCLSADPPISRSGRETTPTCRYSTPPHIPPDRSVHGQHRVARHRRGDAMSRRWRSRQAATNSGGGPDPMPGTVVASPWIKEAPASFECRRAYHAGTRQVAPDLISARSCRTLSSDIIE